MHAKHFIIAGALALGATLGAAETGSITTRDGTTYTNAVIQRADPDGVVIEYAPQPGSVGIAKVKFARLPEELQKRYNYNATDALIFEQNHAAGIARRQEQIEQGETQKQRDYVALWQHRAEVEAALEARRLEAAANEAAQAQDGGWYGGYDGYYDGAWYAVGNRRYRYNSCGPLTGVATRPCSTGDEFAHWPYATGDLAVHYSSSGLVSASGLGAKHGGPGYCAPVASHGASHNGVFATRNPAATGKPVLTSHAVASARPAAGNPTARGSSGRSR